MPPKKLEETFLRQSLWREISTRQFPKKAPTKKYLKKNLLYLREISTKRYLFEEKIYPDMPEGKILYQTRCEGKLSTKQTLNRNPLQTNSDINLCQRVFEEKFAYQTYSAGESLRKKFEEK